MKCGRGREGPRRQLLAWRPAKTGNKDRWKGHSRSDRAKRDTRKTAAAAARIHTSGAFLLNPLHDLSINCAMYSVRMVHDYLFLAFGGVDLDLLHLHLWLLLRLGFMDDGLVSFVT